MIGLLPEAGYGQITCRLFDFLMDHQDTPLLLAYATSRSSQPHVRTLHEDGCVIITAPKPLPIGLSGSTATIIVVRRLPWSAFILRGRQGASLLYALARGGSLRR
jgi:hypothetical protein